MTTDTTLDRPSETTRFETVSGRTRWIAVAGVALLLGAVGFLASDLLVYAPPASFVFLEQGITWGIYALLVLGLNLQFGTTGLVNFGYLVFFILGGYTFALLTATARTLGLGLPWPIGVAAALLAVLLLGVAFGVIALRLRDDFLAIVTLAALLVGLELVESFVDVTGGTNGIYGVPELFGDLAGNFATKVVMTLLVTLGFVLVAYAASQRLAESPYGRVLRSIRSDELVPQTLGKRTFHYKVQVFVLGAVMAAVAGVLLATHQGALSPDFFGLHPTIVVWVGMLLGGAGNNRSVLAGLFLILGINLGLQFLADPAADLFANVRFGAVQQMIVGAVLVVVMRFRPEGIWGNADELEVHE